MCWCSRRGRWLSLGTERMLVEFGKGSLLAKAKSQPDKVKQVLEKLGVECGEFSPLSTAGVLTPWGVKGERQAGC